MNERVESTPEVTGRHDDEPDREAAEREFLDDLRAHTPAPAGEVPGQLRPPAETSEDPFRDSTEGFHARSLEEYHPVHPDEWVEPPPHEKVDREPFGDPREIALGVNENFAVTDQEDEWNTNCVDCARAVERRWRGQDEVASGRADKCGEYGDRVEEWAGQPLRPADEARIADVLGESGHGASAIVCVQYRTGKSWHGHAMNAVNADGRIWLIDGQDGTAAPWPPSENEPFFSSPRITQMTWSYCGWDRNGKGLT